MSISRMVAIRQVPPPPTRPDVRQCRVHVRKPLSAPASRRRDVAAVGELAAAGVYLLRLRSEREVLVRRLVLAR